MRINKKNKKKKYLLTNYIILALVVFAASAVLSMFTSKILFSGILPWDFTDNEVSSISGLIEAIIASVAACLVLYQLKIGNEAEKQQSNIDEAEFVLQYNQSFIQDKNMYEVETLLEKNLINNSALQLIDNQNRQLFINYLVYLESLAPLVLNDVIKLSHVDDLLSYRFFLAVNNPNIQQDQLFNYPDYFRGCFKLYAEWKKHRESKGYPILQEKTSLDIWPFYYAFSNKDVVVRPMNSKTDDRKRIAKLIYLTDQYIYPALFGSIANAKKQLPKMMDKDCVFNHSNIRVAAIDEKIVGVAVVFDKQQTENTIVEFSRGKSGKDVCERYFDKINSYIEADKEAYVLCLCVDPKSRRKKVGATLLADILYTYRDRTVKLDVLKSNESAIALYKNLGFKNLTSRESKYGYAYKRSAPECLKMSWVGQKQV